MILLWILIKKNHPQVYLEECKYRIKKTQMLKFIKTKLKTDSDSDSDLDLDSEVESRSDAKLMAKLEKSDSEWKNTLKTIFAILKTVSLVW